MSKKRAIVAAAAATAAVGFTATQPAFALVQTYSTASGAGGKGIDHPGFGFFQFDPGQWDSGLDAATTHPPAGEFAFGGSDGSFHEEVHTLLNVGVTGRTGDHAAFFEMNYNPNPPTTSFGSFWFGGVGNDIGPYPKLNGVPVPLNQVMVWGDVLAPAGKPMEFRSESAFTSVGNGFKFGYTGTGGWQTVGGLLSAATAYGTFNYNQAQLSVLSAFGQNGNEITAVDDGSDPNNVPTEMVDNLCLTIASANWGANTTGNWGDNTQWNISAPDGPNATAVFGGTIAGAAAVNMDSQHFIGTIQLNSAQSYTIGGAGTLSLRSFNGTTFAPIQSSIDVVQGNHTISAPVELWGGVNINVEQAGSTLTISNLQPTFIAGAGVDKNGPGTLVVNNVRADSLGVHNGKVQVIAGAAPNSPAGTTVVKALTIDAGATLDLTNNSMIIDYSPLTVLPASTIRTMLQSGRLTTSTLAAGLKLGYGDNAVLGKTSFAGQDNIDSTTLLIKYTYAGDATLDGKVDVGDLGALATNYNAGVGSPLVADAAASIAAVPEPASIGLFLFGFAAAATSRRRRCAAAAHHA
ncbi:MAG TPA: PEP-CTERM sorting domain-containing protein [Tepidisphaeraceae bacterium]|nr:PEP-CTERM sorting domain-containing protein [Tepidisphaeraceae bacterium]